MLFLVAISASAVMTAALELLIVPSEIDKTHNTMFSTGRG